MNFEFRNDSPIYLQIAAILEEAIISGKLEAGSKLPSVRELALLSKTNPNTVQKALQILQDKELIYTKRTSGKFVREMEDDLTTLRLKKARTLIQATLHDLQALGLDRNEIEQLFKEEMEHGCQNPKSV